MVFSEQHLFLADFIHQMMWAIKKAPTLVSALIMEENYKKKMLFFVGDLKLYQLFG